MHTLPRRYPPLLLHNKPHLRLPLQQVRRAARPLLELDLRCEGRQGGFEVGVAQGLGGCDAQLGLFLEHFAQEVAG